MDPVQYRANAQARSVIALIDELGLDRPVLGGHDIGSRIAQAVARHRPDLVRALVLTPPLPGIGERTLTPSAPALALALASRSDLRDETYRHPVVALDKCACAELTPIQANLGRRLLGGNEALLDTAAQRLVGLDEPEAAARLPESVIGAASFPVRLSTL